MSLRHTNNHAHSTRWDRQNTFTHRPNLPREAIGYSLSTSRNKEGTQNEGSEYSYHTRKEG